MCPSGKARHTRMNVQTAARQFSIELNMRGQIAQTLYAYRCADCRGWHLTRLAEFEGEKNLLVHEAAPERLQRWAMGETG